MAKRMNNEDTINLLEINPSLAKITIQGTSDLVLNKMGDVTARILAGIRKGKSVSPSDSDYWEERITTMHWITGKPSQFSEDIYNNMVDPGNKVDLPCITGFGLRRACGDAIVRNKADTYKTSFEATVSVVGKRGDLVPVNYDGHYIEEKLMQPKKGSPVLATFNTFTNWSAEFVIKYLPNVYSLEQIVNFINLAGYGIGIGSRRPCGYGRFTVTNVE